MKYIVYCTRNNKNSKIYIGVHQTIDPFTFDGYIGCGLYTHSKTIKPTTAFKSAVKKYGAENFTRTVLAIFDCASDAYDLEEHLVTKEFIRRKDTYNISLGGERGYTSTEKPICQYDMEGKFIKIFDSIEEAAEVIDDDGFNIIRACTTPNKTVKGYYWRYLSKSYENDLLTSYIVEPNTKEVAVVQYSKAGYKMKTWPSIQIAARTFNCDKSSISSTCKGEASRVITGGYQWRYATDKIDKLDPVNTHGGEDKKIIRLSPDGVLVETYNSITEAELKFGLSRVSIHKALRTNKISGGFRWQYL